MSTLTIWEALAETYEDLAPSALGAPTPQLLKMQRTSQHDPGIQGLSLLLSRQGSLTLLLGSLPT